MPTHELPGVGGSSLSDWRTWDTYSMRAGRRYVYSSQAKASYQDVGDHPFIVSRTVEVSDVLMVDVDDDDRILGVEYLGGHITESQLVEVLKRCVMPSQSARPPVRVSDEPGGA